MKILLLFLLACGAAFAQLDTNRLRVIPSPTFTTVGETDYQSKDGLHYTGIAGADTIAASHLFRLPPVDVFGGGCMNSDGSYNLSMGPCGGANSTSVSSTNPLLLYTHFRDDDAAMYLDYSRDYYNWRPVSKTSLYNATNIRDPSVRYDGTTFWFLASPEGVTPCEPQLWSSTDLINFTLRVNINLAGYLSGCNAAVAPEWSHGNTGDPVGFFVGMGDGCATICTAPFFVTFDPAVDGVTPTAATQVTVTGTAYQTHCGKMNTFDMYEYYDPGSAAYYLTYVDWYDGCATLPATQYLMYAKSSTLTGTYTQQTTSGTDHFLMSDQSEGPAVIGLPDSVALYGVAGCVRYYADTWFLTWGAGPPSDANQGNRSYHWKYIDSCPATTGADPFTTMQPMTMVVNTFGGVQVNWVEGPTFSTLITGQVLHIHGSNYTIATIPNPSMLTLTTSPPALLNAPVTVPGVGSVVNITAGEQGTVIALTTQQAANIVYRAEDYWSVNPVMQSRLTIGGKGRGQFPLTVQSNYAYFNLGYDESATIAAGGPDPSATYGPTSFALWSACGVNLLSCPQPSAGEASWIFRYSGFNNAIQLDHQNADTGETAIGFSNGTTQYASPVTGYPAVSTSSLGPKSGWKIGTNNQFFGSIAGSGNVGNNWLYYYNYGLGPHTTSTGLLNPGFESSGSALTSWTTSGSTAVSSGGPYCNPSCAHYGSNSAELHTGSSISQTITGLTASTTYMVTAWVQSAISSTVGPVMTVYYPGFTSKTNNCNDSSGCISFFSWYQIGLQYTTAVGQTSLIISFPVSSVGSGNSFVDDVDLYPLSTASGAFAAGISPSTGELFSNYGITIGNGDPSRNSHFPSVSFDSPGQGSLNIGDGIFGHKNAQVNIGGLTLVNGTGFEIYQRDVAGTSQELLHHATDDNVYLDNYNDGNIFIRPKTSPVGSIFAQGNLQAYELYIGGYGSTLSGSVVSGLLAVNACSFCSLSGTPGTNIAMASFGGSVTGNSGYLGIHQRRVVSGGGWPNTAVGFSFDVDNTIGASASSGWNGVGIWLGASGVGIGNLTPSYPLDVIGDIDTTGSYRINGSTVTSGFYWTGGVQTNFWPVQANGFSVWNGSSFSGGVSGSIGCTYTVVSGTSVCTGLTTNSFIGGIRTN